MANTYLPIASNILSTNTASITFSAIPATYTDLILHISARSNDANTYDQINTRINGDNGSSYYDIYTSSFGTGGNNSSTGFSRTSMDMRFTNGDTSTANTFGSAEIYIPGYTLTQNRIASNFGVSEGTATTQRMGITAHMFTSNTVITSLVFFPASGSNWLAGSSFYLYGIKNS
jgi:hypothetical protein